MERSIGLDFETYSDVDLPTHGLDRYFSGPHYRPLLGSIATWERYRVGTHELDFVRRPAEALDTLREHLQTAEVIFAHNAEFELRVLDGLGLDLDRLPRVVDTAVLARVAGGSSSLGSSARQLLASAKMEEGMSLIRKFSIPGKYQEANDSSAFDPQIVSDFSRDWQLFQTYCTLDARLTLDLGQLLLHQTLPLELDFADVTARMNRVGWNVDLVLVQAMQRQYLLNLKVAQREFADKHDAHDLNLNSLKQLKEWCAKRGVRATSFNEASVAALQRRLHKRVASLAANDPRLAGYEAVLDLLHAKQVLGGSSLKKLQTILDTVGLDGRLRNQYLHCGAGQTLRTSGRGVQMQNLKRLGGAPADVTEVRDRGELWDNTRLANNLRQVFCSSHSRGQLVVGDFASIESRGLAWLAGAGWKLDAFRRGQDMYKLQAAKIFNTRYEDVDPSQRNIGKVGELSCGYGAGPGAVQSFAEGMGVDLSEGEAGMLVADWRAANPEIVQLWQDLDAGLKSAVGGQARRIQSPEGWGLIFVPTEAPESLLRQAQQAGVTVRSVRVTLSQNYQAPVLTRVFHGCRLVGRNVLYFRPSSRKTGEPWSDRFTDPKTKQQRRYELYGGKLAGILTQSLCREVFMRALAGVDEWARQQPNVQLVGQFHDEIVLDWVPAAGGLSLPDVQDRLRAEMTDRSRGLPDFPIDAEIQSSYRYTK